MANSQSVKLCGTGLITHLGKGKPANLARMRTGKANYQSHRLPQFEEAIEAAYLAINTNAAVTTAEEHLKFMLDSALSEALREAKLTEAQLRDMPVYIGSSSYAIAIAEEKYQHELDRELARMPNNDKLQAIAVRLGGLSQISSHLQQTHGLLGADFSYNTACTASANAILSASQSVRSGTSEHALVIGLEAFNTTTLSGFSSMNLLGRDVMQPFDIKRQGLVLGEGCAALIFQASEAGESDGGELLVCGGASRCDTFSIATSNPDGSSIAEVMSLALADTGLKPDNIDVIKAHGAANLASDSSEARGMHRVFSQIPSLTCLKPYVGHTLGACGAIEFALLAAALQDGFIPATAGFSQPDPTLNIAPETSLQAAMNGHYMLNFFGFGGNNCSLIAKYAR